MNSPNEINSVGLVETKTVKIDLPDGGFNLESGETLPEITVAYETYGILSEERDNVVFICHALSGDAHVAGYHDSPNASPSWWDEMVGPGKGIDTNHYFVVCANILGGCRGTTGPSSINPVTKKPYGSEFPIITVGDIVDVHRLLLKQLGITRVSAVIGGSFGGMQVIEWAIRWSDMIDSCVCIASATSLSAQALAFDILGRESITSDDNWQDGNYYNSGKNPSKGLAQARKIGHITYLSPEMMTKKFGRERNDNEPVKNNESHKATVFKSNFQVESYLEHQGKKFVKRFDANSYLHITRAMDEYDLAEKFKTLENAFDPVKAKILVVALSADWLFPPEQSMEIANAMLRSHKQVSYCKLYAPHGHDAFLVDIEHLAEVIRAFLPWVKTGNNKEQKHDTSSTSVYQSYDGKKGFNIILDMIEPESKVLDLGCGNGDLLSVLTRKKKISGIGVDLDIQHVINVIDKGHNIFQEDIDAGLAIIPDNTYDYALLSETLQVVHKPRFVLKELLRVARKGIVSFPNIGNWSHRMHIWTHGRMPKGGALPFEWYETPNIHLFTLNDFIELCQIDGIKILQMVCIPEGFISKLLVKMRFCNLGASRVFVKISRQDESSTHPCKCRIA